MQLSVHQRGDMRCRGIRQRLQVVAAFEQRNDAAVGEAVGDVHDLLRRPGEIGFDQVQVGERTGTMWVIQRGLKAGERVIVQGQQNLKPGMEVQTRPFKTNPE